MQEYICYSSHTNLLFICFDVFKFLKENIFRECMIRITVLAWMSSILFTCVNNVLQLHQSLPAWKLKTDIYIYFSTEMFCSMLVVFIVCLFVCFSNVNLLTVYSAFYLHFDLMLRHKTVNLWCPYFTSCLLQGVAQNEFICVETSIKDWHCYSSHDVLKSHLICCS